jgi:hypothetical protein
VAATQLHFGFIIFGIAVLLVMLFSIRYELKYLSFSKPTLFVRGLSIFSFICMFCLAVVSILHFSLSMPLLVALIGIFAVLLLVITPIQLIFRIRTFAKLKGQRVDEKARLLMEVAHIINEGDEGKAPESKEESGKDAKPE